MTNSPDSLKAWVEALPLPLTLYGFGVEGKETLRFLLQWGAKQVRVVDRLFDAGQDASAQPSGAESAAEGFRTEYPQVLFLGEAEGETCFGEGGTVFRSPGVRPDHPFLEVARANGGMITSATAIFLALAPGTRIGVTGTVGKGTTVTLIGEGLRACGIPFRLAGNIGLNPLSFLAALTPAEVSVLELSSFQLMDLTRNQPQVAIVLRTSTEHLDWHHNLAEYRAAKGGLLAPPEAGQRVIFCADSEGSREIVAQLKDRWAISLNGPVENGIGLAESGLVAGKQTAGGQTAGRLARFNAGEARLIDGLEPLAMPGRFNLENAAAALLAVAAVGGDPLLAARAIASFAGLPHRLERVADIGEIACFNDSYATRPDAAIGALNSFDQPLAVILGGSEKNADFLSLAEAVCHHPSLVRTVLMGTTADRLAGEIAAAAQRLEQSPPTMMRATSLEEAIAMAREGLPERGVLLFSPACASFDMFPNYKVRGERFTAIVRKMAAENGGGKWHLKF